MESGLRDRTVIVTGGSSGIGRQVVIQFVEQGARVLICDTDTEGAVETASMAVSPASVEIATMDVSDESAVADVVRAAGARWGKIDVLCNNAGVMDQMQRADMTSLATWERVMRVNATGTFLMTRAIVPSMLARKSGAIVNTASAAGLRGGSAGAAYTASKHAVVGLTRNVATMYRADGIRCNAVCPGSCNTNILKSAGGPFDENGYASLKDTLASLGRTSEPAEIASVIVFLASDAASFVNGAILSADGGWTAG